MTTADTTSSEGRVEAQTFSRSVHALFDTHEEAERARQDLLEAGIADGAITLDARRVEGDAAPADPAPGFWERMLALFMPEDDRVSYAEGLRRGGFAILVRTDTATYDRVIDILDRDGAVDLDQRQESWRGEGWTGHAGRDPLADATSPALSFATAEEEPRYAPASDATAGFGASEADHFPIGSEAAPLVDSPGALPPEMLDGTPDVQYPASAPGLQPVPEGAAEPGWLRDTSHGRTRVRSYVADAEAATRTGPGRDA